MTSNDEIVERLDKLIALMSIAYSDQIETLRAEVKQGDRGKVLDSCPADWTPAAAARAAAKKAGVSEANFKAKIAELVEMGHVERRGATKSVEYRRRGVI